MAHYHIGSNIPGYLPDDTPYTVRTKRAAQCAVADDVQRYRESEWDLSRSQRRVAHGSARHGYVKFERPNDPYDLGLLFWWARCQEIDCAREED